MLLQWGHLEVSFNMKEGERRFMEGKIIGMDMEHSTLFTLLVSSPMALGFIIDLFKAFLSSFYDYVQEY